MLIHHTANFGDNRHCSGGDVMFLVVEGQDSTCSRFRSAVTVYLLST